MEELSTNEGMRFIQFSLGEEMYAIPLLSIKEVIPFPKTTKLPNSPSYYIGIMNLRGQIISIIDLRKKLNVETSNEDVEDTVIIVEIEGINIGIIVDFVHKVLNFKKDEVVEIPEVSAQINAKYIQGAYKGSDNLTILLDIDGILDINEIVKMHKKVA